MLIAVCLKPVANLQTAYVSKSRSELLSEDKPVANPADLNALELVLGLRSAGDEVLALAVGSQEATEMLRLAAAMGADRAALVEDSQPRDGLATATIAAAALRRAGEVSLVACGARSVVHEAGQVGQRLAQALGMPHAGRVTAAAWANGGADSRSALEVERAAAGPARLALPALLTVEPGCNAPRVPSAMAAVKASRKAIEVLSLDGLELSPQQLTPAVRLRLTHLPEEM